MVRPMIPVCSEAWVLHEVYPPGLPDLDCTASDCLSSVFPCTTPPRGPAAPARGQDEDESASEGEGGKREVVEEAKEKEKEKEPAEEDTEDDDSSALSSDEEEEEGETPRTEEGDEEEEEEERIKDPKPSGPKDGKKVRPLKNKDK
jgi:hypothetical protein